MFQELVAETRVAPRPSYAGPPEPQLFLLGGETGSTLFGDGHREDSSKKSSRLAWDAPYFWLLEHHLSFTRPFQRQCLFPR